MRLGVGKDFHRFEYLIVRLLLIVLLLITSARLVIIEGRNLLYTLHTSTTQR